MLRKSPASAFGVRGLITEKINIYSHPSLQGRALIICPVSKFNEGAGMQGWG